MLLPLLDDKTVVMIRNFRVTIGKWLWELAAGTLEPPELPAACAARELREETGYEAGVCWSRCLAFTRRRASPMSFCMCLWRKGLKQVGQDLMPDEQVKVEAVSLDEALAGVARVRSRTRKP